MPPIPVEQVSIVIARYGTSLEVEGQDRTQIHGLWDRLVHELGRSATNSPANRAFMTWPGALSVAPLMLAFRDLSHKLKLASVDNKWEPAEIGAIVLAVAIGCGFSALGWWLFPPLELLDEGQATRFRRFRGRLSAAVGALVLAVLAAYIYGWLNPR